MPADRRTLAICGAATLVLAACAGVGHPPPPAPLLAPRERATLTLDLADMFGGQRALLALRTVPRKARVQLLAPDLSPMLTRTLDLAGAGTLATLDDVPIGPRWLLRLEGLDADGRDVPGLALRAVGAIGPGTNTLAVSALSDVAGRVVESLAEQDKAGGSKIVETLDFVALSRMVGRYARELGVASPGLLDVEAIAAAVRGAGGGVPAPNPGFVLGSGRVLLRPLDWPPGVTALAVLDDPASQPTPIEGKPALLGPAAPGTWRLTVTPDQPGLQPASLDVEVEAGKVVAAAVGFGVAAARDPLPEPRGAAAGGLVRLPDGSDALAIAGGVTRVARAGDPAPPRLATTVLQLPAVPDQQPLGLPAGVAAPAVALDDGRLFWVGGADDRGATGKAFMYDPAGGGRVLARAALPDGLGLIGAAAGAIGGKILLTGGFMNDGSPWSVTLAYDPAGDAWAAAGLPALAPHRALMASAVVDGTWYLFGGLGSAAAGAPPRPVATVSALRPGRDQAFRTLRDMPTPRAAAAVAVADGKIWLIGGVTRYGALSGAVEVYDPATDGWSVRPPLRRPRAMAAAGLVGGVVLVAGGLLGTEPGSDEPVADVEALAP